MSRIRCRIGARCAGPFCRGRPCPDQPRRLHDRRFQPARTPSATSSRAPTARCTVFASRPLRSPAASFIAPRLDGSTSARSISSSRRTARRLPVGLLLASDGLLYGTTKFGQVGQLDGAGTVFRIAADGTGFPIIHRFAPFTAANVNSNPINTNGAYSEAELVEGADGYLYGMARVGGPNGTGTIFKIARDGTDFQLLHSFAAVTSTAASGVTVTVDGAAPAGSARGGHRQSFLRHDVAGRHERPRHGLPHCVRRHRFPGPASLQRHDRRHRRRDCWRTPTARRRCGGLVDGGDGFFYGRRPQGGTAGNGVICSRCRPTARRSPCSTHFNGADGARPAAELMRGQQRQVVRRDVRRRHQCGAARPPASARCSRSTGPAPDSRSCTASTAATARADEPAAAS